MDNLILQEKNNWLYVTLNRPEKKNALDLSLINNLLQVFSNLTKQTHIKGIYLRGSGSSFCAGADLKWIQSASKDAHLLFELLETMDSVGVPLVAHAHGCVYGGGIGLLSVCDIVSADIDVQFCFSELKLGLIPAVIAPFILKKLSLSKAKELIFSTRVFYGKEALADSLIHQLGTEEECAKWRESLMTRMNSLDHEAIKKTKQVFTHMYPTHSLKKYCSKLLDDQRKSSSAQKRILQFLNKKS